MTPCVVLPETGESNQIDFQVINDVFVTQLFVFTISVIYQ